MQYLALKLISLYQILFSPQGGFLMVLGVSGSCKYDVSCSEYTKQQITQHGVLTGSYKGIRRIISCR